MDKNIIKTQLIKRFIHEGATPGIDVTAKANKESGKINKDGVAAVAKDIKSYEKPIKEDPNTGNMAKNKYNYTDEAEKTYHDEMETLNGQEMIQYSREPGAEFKERSEEAIIGSSRMGNSIGANAEEVWNASSDEFGKNLVKRIKNSEKKRADAAIQTAGIGDVQIPTGNKVKVATTAVGSGKPKGDTTNAMQSASDKTKIKVVKEGISEKNVQVLTNWVQKMGPEKAAEKLINSLSQTGMISDLPDSMEYGQGLNRVGVLLSKQNFDMAYKSAKALASKLEKNAMRDMMGEATESIDKPNQEQKDENNNKVKIKESMKRITFKKEFEGSNTTQKIGHALTLIPEGYRANNKEFELTDGNVTCRIRWEGNITEGKAIVLSAANNTLISEDMSRMKALMGYKSQDTLGLVKGKSRVDENAAFGDIWKKSRRLLGESDDIEDADAIEGSADSLDTVVKVASEAKKHVEGSVSNDNGTDAPTPKKGEWDKINVAHAADAKKHVEGSVADVKKTEAPTPKVGEWDKIKISKSADANKHVESGVATNKATDTAKVVKENFDTEEEEAEGPEAEDTYNKPDADDDSSIDNEPSAKDIKGEVPPAIGDEDDAVAVPPAKGGAKLMKSQSTGEHYIMQGNNAIKVSPNFVELATKNSKNPAMLTTILTKMQDEADLGSNEDDDELDEAECGEEMNTNSVEEGMFGNDDKKNAKAQEFDQINSKLIGTKYDQTNNKLKWLERAKSEDNYNGNFIIDRGVLQYVAKSKNPLQGVTGGSSGMGTANENKK